MDETPSEILFLRWLQKHDLAALEAVLDRAWPELIRLAVRLAPNVAEAEALVQATLVGALESARRFDPTRPLLPWLVGILTRQAHKSRRRAARRVDPRRLHVERSED